MTSLARLALLHLTVAAFSACSSQALEVNPVRPDQAPYTPDDVQVVDQSRFDALRQGGTHDIRGPLGEVTANAGCASGSVDDACVAAAHQQLREQAAARSANLVVIVRSSTMQSFPPRYSATGELYEITARR